MKRLSLQCVLVLSHAYNTCFYVVISIQFVYTRCIWATFTWNVSTCVAIEEADADSDGEDEEYATANSGEEEGEDVVSQQRVRLVTTTRGMKVLKNILPMHTFTAWHCRCVTEFMHGWPKEQPSIKCYIHLQSTTMTLPLLLWQCSINHANSTGVM